MASVTEVARLFFKPGENPSKPGNASKQWQEAVDAVLAHEGTRRVYWNMEVEHPEVLRLFIDWETLEHHTKWMQAEDYPPKRAGLRSLLAGPPTVFHCQMSPHPPTAALTAPATEVLSIYFPSTLSTDSKAAAETGITNLLRAIERHAAGYKGSAGGWAVEEVGLPTTPEAKGLVYVALIGWTSVEAHLAFRETKEFEECAAHLKGVKDMAERSVVHVHCINAGK